MNLGKMPPQLDFSKNTEIYEIINCWFPKSSIYVNQALAIKKKNPIPYQSIVRYTTTTRYCGSLYFPKKSLYSEEMVFKNYSPYNYNDNESDNKIITNTEQDFFPTRLEKYEIISLEYSSFDDELTNCVNKNLCSVTYQKKCAARKEVYTPELHRPKFRQFSYAYRDKVSRKNKQFCSIYGLSLSILNRMVIGVSVGFAKVLLISGVGYRAQLEGKLLTLNLGYSHAVPITVPDNLSVVLENPTRLSVSGIQKEAVGEFAARVRRTCPPEPYKGKGISYEKEIIRRKVGKTGK
jgi:large subunit ribosomal protein L6